MANEFVARNGIISLDGGQITGSLRVTQGVTASLFGTASWAINSTTASFVLNAVSSSFAATASFIATSSLAGNFFSQAGNSFGTLAILGTNDNQALVFETNGSEKMRLAATRNNFLVNQTGSLGGVTASIELSGNGSNDATEQASYQIYANHGTFAANTGYFVFNKSRGTTQGAVTAVASGDRLGMIRWNGADGASQVRAAEIYAEVDGAVSTNDMPGRIVFATTLDGASTPTERMRITNAGLVGIGTTSPNVSGQASGVGVLTIQGSTNYGVIELSQNASTSDGTLAGAVGFTNNQLSAGYKLHAYIGSWLQGGGVTSGGDLRFYTQISGTAGAIERMRINASGSIGIGTTSPLNTLHVVGTGRFTDSLAISTAVSTGDAFIELGTGRSASGNAYIDLVGDTTYTDFALRIIRGSAGANATSQIVHRGTGAFSIIAQDAASLALSTTNSARLTILSGGSIGIGTTTAGSLLQVNGNTAIGYAASTAAPTNGLTVSGSVGIGTTVAPWASTFRVLQLGARTTLFNSDINFTGLYNNIYYDGAAYRYLTTAAASSIELGNGVITFGTVASGTAGNTAAGSERMRIINDGNVGIGTTAPVGRLQVSGSVVIGANASNYQLNIFGSTTSYISLNNTNSGTAGNQGFQIGLESTGEVYFLNRQNAFMQFRTNNLDRVRITADGNVGINTSSPNYRLEVAGDSSLSTAHFTHNGANGGINVHNTSSLTAGRDAQLRLANGTTYFGASDRSYQLVNEGASTTTADFYIQYWNGTSYNQRFRINSSGNVGIGTTSPSHKLQVIGAVPANEAISNIISFTDASSNTGYLGIARSSSTENGTALTSDGKLVFRVGSTTEAMTIRSSGNVGIGTTSPQALLHINSSASHTFAYSTISGASPIALDNQSGALAIWTASTERMRITSGGNVLIGGTSGITTNALGIGGLQIQSSTLAVTQLFTTANNVDGAYLGLWKARGANIVQNNDDLGGLLYGGYDGASYRNGAAIIAQVDGTPGTGDMPSRLVFYTTPDGASSYTEKMRITSGGNVGIGQPSPTNKLDIAVSNRTSLSAQASAIVSDYIGSTTGQYQTIGFSWASSISSLVSYWGLGFRATNYSSGLGDTFLYAGGAERLTVTHGGNVIIGGTTSTYKLHVVSAPGSILALGEESFTTGKQLLIGINASADTEIQAVHQGTAYTDILLNPSGGSVGIGTTAPGAALEVNGAIKTSNPASGTAQPWKLGKVIVTSVVLDETQYVEVDINGNAYKLALVNPA